jgi:hypothetical protein
MDFVRAGFRLVGVLGIGAGAALLITGSEREGLTLVIAGAVLLFIGLALGNPSGGPDGG